jgi:hypothetical protein
MGIRGESGMRRAKLATAILGLGLFLIVSGQASADPTCTTFDSANGTTAYPGTYVGLVSGTCQIGKLTDPSQGMALVNSTTNTASIYVFQLTSAGNVTITDQLGNNGTNSIVDVELFALANATASPTGSELASINIPVATGGTGVLNLVPASPATFLNAGYYAIDSYLASGDDPRYQLIITETAATAPEIDPNNGLAAIALLAGIVLVFRGRRAKEQTVAGC